jgi:phosphatidylserine decarboxylase
MRQGLAKKLVPLSVREGRLRDAFESARDIRPFVDGFRGEINVEEAELPLEEYKTFNQFFYRKLKPGLRPVSSPDDADVVVSAADCRLQVFESVDEATRFWVKGRTFSVAGLLADTDAERPLASQFSGGSMAIFRLAPQGERAPRAFFFLVPSFFRPKKRTLF